jgi:hypothetical protein
MVEFNTTKPAAKSEPIIALSDILPLPSGELFGEFAELTSVVVVECSTDSEYTPKRKGLDPLCIPKNKWTF